MKTHLEIEAKYDVADGQQLPDLIAVGGVDSMTAQAEMVLTATYFDTAEHSLAAVGATLRRRTGGTDDGWHLKLPLADGERLEVHRPLGRGQEPPVALTGPLLGLLRGHGLEAVATLVNRRTVHLLLDRDGRVLAELADDSVTGERHDVEGHTLTWRELEIELVDGDRAVLAALDGAVRAAGVVPAAGTSKLGRVLGASATRASQRPSFRRSTPVGDVLDAALRQAVLDLLGADPLVRLDRPHAPTRMRAAVQRLRAALALHRQVTPDEASMSIRYELAWLDTVLAGVEELDRTRARIREALAVEPRDLVLGPVRRRADRELTAGRRTSLAVVREALESPRYLELFDSVAHLLTRTPTQPAAPGRADDVLPDLAARALARAEHRLAQLRRAQSEDERRRQLHGAQRAVERARFAELLASGWTGATQGRLEATLDEVATVLARLDVCTPAQEALRDLAVQAHLAGENGFTFGRLHGLEQANAAALVRDTKKLGKDLRRLGRL